VKDAVSIDGTAAEEYRVIVKLTVIEKKIYRLLCARKKSHRKWFQVESGG